MRKRRSALPGAEDRFDAVFGSRRGSNRVAAITGRWWTALPEIMPGRRDLIHFLDEAAITGLVWVKVDGEVSVSNDRAARLTCTDALDREPGLQRLLATDQLLAFTEYWPRLFQRASRMRPDPRWRGWLCEHDISDLDREPDW